MAATVLYHNTSRSGNTWFQVFAVTIHGVQVYEVFAPTKHEARKVVASVPAVIRINLVVIKG